jgi:hypothetical protein
MGTAFHPLSRTKKASIGGKTLVSALGLLFLTGAAFADDPLSMAPPISSAEMQSADGATVNAGPDSVFNWSEVPQNQQVPINRAVFDQGGYQLYDSQGETIVVPFTNQNLYVMKFGRSDNGSFYFVNEGSVPVLYVPDNGYLENATVPGAHWYPFSAEFHPSHPVFIGIAPSWHEYVDMGWYPGMYCHGGYWGETSFISGGIFLPTIGLFFVIGDHHYYGWNHYHDYYFDHPAPYRTEYFHHDVYRWADRPHADGRYFGGADHRAGGYHSFGNGRTYGNGRTFGGGRDAGSDHSYYTHRSFGGVVRSNDGGHALTEGHVFRGTGQSGDGGHSFGTGQTYGGGSAADSGHTYGGRVFGGRVFGGGRPSESNSTGGNPRTFSGGGDNRSFRDAYTHSDSGNAGRSNSGGDHSSNQGGRSNSGGDHSSRSSGGDRSGGGSDRGGGGNHGSRSSR